MARNVHIGSSFDEFLQAEGLLEESSAVALKRVIAWQLTEAMKLQGVTKSAMASRMQTSRSQLDRVLGGQGSGMTLETLSRAIDALGLQIRLEMQGKVVAKKAVRKVVASNAQRPALAPARKRKADAVVRRRA